MQSRMDHAAPELYKYYRRALCQIWSFLFRILVKSLINIQARQTCIVPVRVSFKSAAVQAMQNYGQEITSIILS